MELREKIRELICRAIVDSKELTLVIDEIVKLQQPSIIDQELLMRAMYSIEKSETIFNSFSETEEDEIRDMLKSLPKSEKDIVLRMDKMCADSLDIETHDKWEDVRNVLESNRKFLK